MLGTTAGNARFHESYLPCFLDVPERCVDTAGTVQPPLNQHKCVVDHEAGSSGDWLGFCSGYVVLFIPIPNREDVGRSITTLM